MAAFQDASYLYLVMEYMPGGDFLGLLIRKNTLSEHDTKWYMTEMILCLEESHKLGWIHRDIKPDNFLVTATGHLKISDFGLAFDGHWSHDQAYFNVQRQNLLHKWHIPLVGDEQDKQEDVYRDVREQFDKHMKDQFPKHDPYLVNDEEHERVSHILANNRISIDI